MSAAPWHVLGAGAIGCLYADWLARAGAAVTLILRHAAARSVSVVIEADGAQRAQVLPCTDAAATEPISQLVITTKAYDVLPAVAGIAHRLNSGATVLLLVNGMGLAETLARDHPDLAVYAGTTTLGAHRLAQRHIRFAGAGSTRVGRSGCDSPPAWFSLWARAVPDCHWDDHIDDALWAKLAVNCVINPLTALHGCDNGALASRAELAAQVALLCREVAQVSYAAGYTRTAQDIDAMVAQVIRDTARNRSSMLQDVSAGRPTEIDFITGHLLTVAQRFGIEARHNRRLFAEVKALAPA